MLSGGLAALSAYILFRLVLLNIRHRRTELNSATLHFKTDVVGQHVSKNIKAHPPFSPMYFYASEEVQSSYNQLKKRNILYQLNKILDAQSDKHILSKYLLE